MSDDDIDAVEIEREVQRLDAQIARAQANIQRHGPAAERGEGNARHRIAGYFGSLRSAETSSGASWRAHREARMR